MVGAGGMPSPFPPYPLGIPLKTDIVLRNARDGRDRANVESVR